MKKQNYISNLFADKKLYFFLFIFILNGNLIAQNKLTDSLQTFINTTPNDTLKVQAMMHYGRYLFENGDKKSAFNKYQEALDISINKGMHFQQQKILFFMGTQYDIIGNRTKAIELYFQGLSIAEKYKDTVSQAHFLNNIGLVYYTQLQVQKAIEYYTKSLNIGKVANNKSLILNPLGNLGIIHLDNGEYKKAIEEFREAARIAYELGDSATIAISYSYIGLSNIKLKDFTAALKYLNDAKLVTERVGDSYIKTDIMNMYAELYIEQKLYNKAIVILEKNIPEAEAIDYLQAASDAEKFLSDAYLKVGNHAKAFSHFKLYTALKDSLSNAEIIKNQTLVELNYEINRQKEIDKSNAEIQEIINQSEKKQVILYSAIVIIAIGLILVLILISRKNEIHKRKRLEAENQLEKERQMILEEKNRLMIEESESLKNLNDELTKIANDLKYNNAQKDKMFSVLAHDLKSPFQGILGISTILVDDFEILEKEQIYTFLSTLKPAVFNVYGLLENLLQWSRMQLNRVSFNRMNFNIQPMVCEIVNLLNENITKKNITVNIDIEEDLILNADINMIRSIISNFTSNAVKFTNKNGNIKIEGHHNDGSFILNFIDDGIGISNDNLSKLFDISENFTTTGTDGEAGTGLGLLICKEMVIKHGGNILVDSIPGKGTKFTIVIPD